MIVLIPARYRAELDRVLDDLRERIAQESIPDWSTDDVAGMLEVEIRAPKAPEPHLRVVA